MNFNWGTGAITPYGRDYVSARWQGKLLAPASENFTLYIKADDAARLYVDHELVIDGWEGVWFKELILSVVPSHCYRRSWKFPSPILLLDFAQH